jgi:hypothetical protein
MNPDLMYILMMFITTQTGSTSSSTAEFYKKEACEIAATQFQASVPKTVKVYWTCVPKLETNWGREG